MHRTGDPPEEECVKAVQDLDIGPSLEVVSRTVGT